MYPPHLTALCLSNSLAGDIGIYGKNRLQCCALKPAHILIFEIYSLGVWLLSREIELWVPEQNY
jgi:hypothetical protein